jgi:hypothetical protein
MLDSYAESVRFQDAKLASQQTMKQAGVKIKSAAHETSAASVLCVFQFKMG